MKQKVGRPKGINKVHKSFNLSIDLLEHWNSLKNKNRTVNELIEKHKLEIVKMEKELKFNSLSIGTIFWAIENGKLFVANKDSDNEYYVLGAEYPYDFDDNLKIVEIINPPIFNQNDF